MKSTFNESPGSAPFTYIGPVAGPFKDFTSSSCGSRIPSNASHVSTRRSSPESIVMAGFIPGSKIYIGLSRVNFFIKPPYVFQMGNQHC